MDITALLQTITGGLLVGAGALLLGQSCFVIMVFHDESKWTYQQKP